MSSLNKSEIRKSYCLTYLKEMNSIRNLIENNHVDKSTLSSTPKSATSITSNNHLKSLLEELENYVEQMKCVKNSQIIFCINNLNIKEITIFKLNNLINEKLDAIKYIL